MTELTEYARNKNIKYIEGWLSGSDIEDYEERLFHFYEKFGFEIIKHEQSVNNRYEVTLKL